MGLLKNIAIFILAVSFFTFVSFFGRLPVFRNTPIGFLSRVIWVHIPNVLQYVDRKISGGRIFPALSRMGHRLLYEKHPVVVIFFLGLITGAAGMLLTSAWRMFSFWQLLPVPALVAAPYILTYFCMTSTADYITPSNHVHAMRMYPYDHITFRPHEVCRTCHLTKPARSKHCSICKACVMKADHHCVWVNNCLGKHNYKYFLALLLSVAVMEWYGVWLVWSIRPHLLGLHHASSDPRFVHNPTGFFDRITDQFITAILIGGLSITGVGLLAFLTAPLAFGLFLYHVYLVWAGMTTNESSKWSDWKDEIPYRTVFKARYSAVQIGMTKLRARRQAEEAEDHQGSSALPEAKDPPASPDARPIAWPKRTDQVLIRTLDGQFPDAENWSPEGGPIVQPWSRVTSLKEVDNLYDLGWRGNLRDVLYLDPFR